MNITIRNFRTTATLAFVLAVAMTSVSQADGVGICDNCTPIQMQEAATGVYTDNSIVHMLDFVQGIYRSYFVEVISEPGISRTLVQEIPTPPDAAEKLQNTLDFAAFLVQDKEINVSQLPLGGNPIGSAIDLAANPTESGGLVHAVELWLADSAGNGGIVVATNVLSKLSGLVANNTVTVHFPDGTTARVQITSITVDENNHPVLFGQIIGLYRSDNRPIPTTSSAVNGMSTDINNQAELDAWLNLMQRLGIPVTDGTTPAQGAGGGRVPPEDGPPLPTRMECRLEGGQVTCKVVPLPE